MIRLRCAKLLYFILFAHFSCFYFYCIPHFILYMEYKVRVISTNCTIQITEKMIPVNFFLVVGTNLHLHIYIHPHGHGTVYYGFGLH